MRYHWGLGVGHIHAHQHAFSKSSDPTPLKLTPEDKHQNIQSPGRDPEGMADENGAQSQDGNSDVEGPDNPELCLQDRDWEGWEDVASVDSDSDSEVGGGADTTEEEDYAESQ
jgi:hypothetical protein